jgi:hypothetical protein
MGIAAQLLEETDLRLTEALELLFYRHVVVPSKGIGIIEVIPSSAILIYRQGRMRIENILDSERQGRVGQEATPAPC